MYWEREQEITLLHLVLEANHPDNWSSADRNLCGLIEMGLVDMDKGPAAFQAWRDQDPDVADYEVSYEFVAKHYRDPDDFDDEDDDV